MYGTDGAHPSEGGWWACCATEGPALSVRKSGSEKKGQD